MKLILRAVVPLLLAGSPLAHAQWEWRDANNVRHLSDQPPPPSVPPSRILKAPRGQMPDLRKELAERPAAPPPAPAPGKPPATGKADAEAALRLHREEAAQQAAVQVQNKAAAAAACDNARSNLRTLESGMRIATVDANGQQAYLDDAQKAEQLRSNRAALAAQCR